MTPSPSVWTSYVYAPKGIGFHHAGLDPGDRQVVERLFLEGMLPVLVSTTTLAMGVNLPAHLVIVKSTTHMENNEYKEYSESQVRRVLGIICVFFF